MAPQRSLEVDDDMEFQRHDWTFERVGWMLMLLVIAAAGVGLLGHGPLSATERFSADRSLRVVYGRFERHGSLATLAIHARRHAPADSGVMLWIGREFLDGIQLHWMTPQPASERSVSDRVMYEFALAAGADTAHVTIRYTPQAIGTRSLQVGETGAAALSLTQFVYP